MEPFQVLWLRFWGKQCSRASSQPSPIDVLQNWLPIPSTVCCLKVGKLGDNTCCFAAVGQSCQAQPFIKIAETLHRVLCCSYSESCQPHKSSPVECLLIQVQCRSFGR